MGRHAHKLAGKVALDGERDVAGTAGVDAPAAIGVLVAEDFGQGALHAGGIAAFEKHVQEDVVSLEHGVGFELAAPVAVRMLLAEDEIAGAAESEVDLRKIGVDAPKRGIRDFPVEAVPVAAGRVATGCGRAGILLMRLSNSKALVLSLKMRQSHGAVHLLKHKQGNREVSVSVKQAFSR